MKYSLFDVPASQTVGYDGIIAIPQIPGVLVEVDLPIQTNPWFPQDAPHEFLTCQYGTAFPETVAVLYPTAKTPWSKEVPQAFEVMTPEVYN